MRMITIGSAILFLGICPVVGCGGATLDEIAPSLEGVYIVDTWSRNEESCEAEGESIVDQLEENHLVLAQGKAMGQVYLEAVSCSDVADCEAKGEAIPSNGNFVAWYTFAFTDSKGANELAGEYLSTGFSSSDSDLCTEGELADRSLQLLNDGTIRIEERTRLADHPKDDRGYCTTEGTRAAAAGEPCSRMQVITARRLEG